MRKLWKTIFISSILIFTAVANLKASGLKKSTRVGKTISHFKNVAPKVKQEIWFYARCTDGSREAVGLLSIYSTTVGGQTVVTSIYTSRAPSLGCTLPLA
jgi:hypothetical protein